MAPVSERKGSGLGPRGLEVKAFLVRCLVLVLVLVLVVLNSAARAAA